jgi:hypothetical protein
MEVWRHHVVGVHPLRELAATEKEVKWTYTPLHMLIKSTMWAEYHMLGYIATPARSCSRSPLLHIQALHDADILCSSDDNQHSENNNSPRSATT